MKRWLSVMFLGVAVAATPAIAGGPAERINLSWSDCGTAGQSNRDFTCDTNAGTSHTMVCSFTAPDSIDLFTGVAIVIDIKSSTDPVPDWWRLRNQNNPPPPQTNQCRNGSLSASADFTSFAACTDPFGGNGSGGLSNYRVGGPSDQNDLSRVRLGAAFALAAGSEVPLTPGTEYYAVRFTINNAKTTGGGTVCGGCTVPMSITLNGVQVVQPANAPGGDVWVTEPLNNRTITWQGGAGAAPVPTRSATWGRVKHLYR